MRVLVADDDPEMRDAVAAALAERGAEVVTVPTGSALIEQLGDDYAFDLLITDINMPWMSGLQIAHAVRSAGLGMPIIVITARADGDVERQMQALGTNTRLLRKPFDLRELERAMDSVATT